MEEQPPEPKLELGFVKADLRKELQRLWQECLRTRDYGIEHRMDHGRALLDMRSFLKQYEFEFKAGAFDRVCEALETTGSEARTRIAMAMTWDSVRTYLDESGSSVRMPRNEAHLMCLFKVDPVDRGQIWEKIYTQAVQDETLITAQWMESWIKDYKALPVPSEEVEDDGIPRLGEEEIEGEIEVSNEEVPHGTKEAVATDVEDETPGDGPGFEHPEVIKDAIRRIASICGGQDNPEAVESWRSVLSDQIKISFQDLLAWDNHNDDEIRKIGRLIHGDFGAGLRTAIRIVDKTIDTKTRMEDMIHHCIADGGRWEHIEGGFRIVVTKLKDRSYEP